MSPLGKYGQQVAALVAVAVIGVYLVALVLDGSLLELEPENLTALDKAAFLALGAVFGAAAAVNGVKSQVEPAIRSAHSRVDALEVATGVPTHGSQLPAPGSASSSDQRDAAERYVSPIDGGPGPA